MGPSVHRAMSTMVLIFSLVYLVSTILPLILASPLPPVVNDMNISAQRYHDQDLTQPQYHKDVSYVIPEVSNTQLAETTPAFTRRPFPSINVSKRASKNEQEITTIFQRQSSQNSNAGNAQDNPDPVPAWAYALIGIGAFMVTMLGFFCCVVVRRRFSGRHL